MKPAKLALHSTCQDFLAFLRDVRHYSAHTIHSYESDLIALSKLFEHTPPEKISTQQIRKLTNQLHSKELSARSIARHLSCWRSFFSWLSDKSDTQINPVLGIKAPKRGKRLPKALSVDEAVHLVDHALGNNASQLVDHAMFELLYSSGLRVSELVALDMAFSPQSNGWIDLIEKVVHVTGKGNKKREVPIGDAAILALTAWLEKRPSLEKTEKFALFLTSRGSRMSVRSVQVRIKAHANLLMIKSNVHPHVLRHSFASHVLQSSGDLRAVQELLGHASLASTQVYTSLDFQHLSKTYDAAHPRAKSK